MKWIFLPFGFILLFIVVIWFAMDLKKKLKEEQDEFENAKYIEKEDDLMSET